ncbi:hypothetical protein B296_00042242 [Ensete ventricosum]|uniref:Uncharacterized protein n=1 Tax=Ensete ventricosum TaxID=4639 RepID=A0A426Y5I1_ENSVE|nr:hypothetical protein B296_00042242 [Ensete ventricosum]
MHCVYRPIIDKNVNKVFDEMLIFVCVLRFMYIPCTASSGLAGPDNGAPILAKAHIRLREPDKSEDKAEKRRRCKTTDSRAMGLAAPWYRRGRTSMESLIPCSHRGRALVVKGAKEVENAEANSKYQDRAKGQRLRNFIRPVSMGFSLR